MLGKTGRITNPEPAGKILVWDLPTRLFHWSLVLATSSAAITGFLAPEWWLNIHVWSGYIIIALVVFRIIWGFAGSPCSRFASFLFSPAQTISHLRSLLNRKPGHFTGHNPAGAIMIFALLAILAAIGISGLVTLGGQENQGPFAGFTSFAAGHTARELHEILATTLLFMIAGHLIGVFIESCLLRENLVRSMFTGMKTAYGNPKDLASHPQSSILAAIIVIILLLAGATTIWALGRIPASGIIAMPANSTYSSECGDCHSAFHPSLLPAASWRQIMTSLDDHFGEDASLDQQTASKIASFLDHYSAEHWDTEAANNLRHISAQNPLIITASPYWQHRHSNISDDVFKQKNVGSKSNCDACHADAQTGLFADQMIKIAPVQINQKP